MYYKLRLPLVAVAFISFLAIMPSVLDHKTNLTPATCYWSACTKPRKWVFVLCVLEVSILSLFLQIFSRILELAAICLLALQNDLTGKISWLFIHYLFYSIWFTDDCTNGLRCFLSVTEMSRKVWKTYLVMHQDMLLKERNTI